MKQLTWNELKSGLWPAEYFFELEKECHSEHKAPGVACLFCCQLLHQANFPSVLEMCLFELPFPQSPPPHQKTLGIAEFWNRLYFERYFNFGTWYGAQALRSPGFLGPHSCSQNRLWAPDYETR